MNTSLCEPCVANGFPVDSRVKRAFDRDGGSILGDGSVLERDYIYWHRRDLQNNGTSQLTFFNQPRSRGVTNLDVAGQINSNYLFKLAGIMVSFLPGFDVNGNRVSTTADQTVLSFGEQVNNTEDAIANQWKWAENVRDLLQNAKLSFFVGEQKIVETFGLEQFPQGGGVYCDAQISNAIADNAAENQVTDAITNIWNGPPLHCNRMHSSHQFGIAGGQQFRAEIDWAGTSPDFTDATLGPLAGETAGNAAGVLMVGLHGVLYSLVST